MRERNSNIDNPVVLEESKNNIVGYDVFSRLLKDRIIFLGQEINDEVANVVIGELLYLDMTVAPIHMYINCVGGMVSSGFGIYDTMKFIKSPVYTYCVGEAASMAAVLLSAGESGHRYSLPHSRIMIHQPSGGAVGTCSDVQIAAKEINRIKQELCSVLAKNTGKSIKTIEKDSDRDSWMTATEAEKYGIIDKVLYGKESR